MSISSNYTVKGGMQQAWESFIVLYKKRDAELFRYYWGDELWSSTSISPDGNFLLMRMDRLNEGAPTLLFVFDQQSLLFPWEAKRKKAKIVPPAEKATLLHCEADPLFVSDIEIGWSAAQGVLVIKGPVCGVPLVFEHTVGVTVAHLIKASGLAHVLCVLVLEYMGSFDQACQKPWSSLYSHSGRTARDDPNCARAALRAVSCWYSGQPLELPFVYDYYKDMYQNGNDMLLE